MTLAIPAEVRAKAEVYEGDAAGQEKTRLLLQEAGLPSGLLPLRDIIECGYVEETGFVWLKQRRHVDHYFAKAGRHVSYAAEVSAVAEQGRLKRITGVKAKEMLLWVALHEICVDNPPKGKLHRKAIGGLSRSFPVEAFEAEGPPPVFTPRNVVGGGCGGLKPRAPAAEEEEEEKDVAAPEEEDAAGEKEEEAPDAAVDVEDEKPKEEEKEETVDKVGEKLKEMTTEVAPHKPAAEAVTANN